jgi:hypothetical protein
MKSMKVITINDPVDQWIEEPRWSWYGTPLWRTWAMRFTLIAHNIRNLSSTGPTQDDFRMNYFTYTLYMTEEEYVMFKLEVGNFSDMDMMEIRKGKIYS